VNANAKSAAVALGMGIAAAILFGVGLIGALTPSYGRPSLAAWFICSLVPIVLTFVGSLVARNWAVKMILVLEGTIIFVMTIDLLHIHRIF
jgi:hypothetical protein